MQLKPISEYKPINEYKTKELPAIYCHEKTIEKFPTVKSFTIPREVMDRLDLTPAAKLVFGIIAQWRGWVKLRIDEIAGLAGLSAHGAKQSLRQLERKKLLERKSYMSFCPGLGPRTITSYKTIRPPRRHYKVKPAILNNTIEDMNETFRRFFHEIDIDS